MHPKRKHLDSEIAGIHILLAEFQNLCSHLQLLKENKPTLLLEIFNQYASHGEEKLGRF